MDQVIKKRRRTTKKIGDPTTITIPRAYIDYVTKEEKEVTKELLTLMNNALENREFVHLVMTGISRIMEKPSWQEDFSGFLIGLENISSRMENIHKFFYKQAH